MSGLINPPGGEEVASIPNHGQPVQIISIENGKFKLNNEELERILTHPVTKHKPVRYLYFGIFISA